MKRFHSLLVFIVAGAVAFSSQADEAYSGTWTSEAVKLARGDLDEIYFFTVSFVGQADSSSFMDIRYYPAAKPEQQRLIRQSFSLSNDPGTHQWILNGSEPRLITGPNIVGVYEPDTLFCTASENRLECDWGSSAHGIPPKVILYPDASAR